METNHEPEDREIPPHPPCSFCGSDLVEDEDGLTCSGCYAIYSIEDL